MNLLRTIHLGLFIVLGAAAVSGGVLLFRDISTGDPIDAVANRHAHDVIGWELRHLPQKWAYKVATLFDGSRSQAEEDALLERYFELTSEIRFLEREGPADRLYEARQERDSIMRDVEQVLESRISGFLREEGLVINPPLFSDIDLFLPPLDFTLDQTPRVLAVSPRDRITLDRSYLLAPGLELDDVLAIEAEAEETGMSALVVGTGGVAMYPSVIPASAPYHQMVETIIHEWLHQHLVFYPLGRDYFRSNETRTINETVANLAGQELAGEFIERYGSPLPPPAPAQPRDDGFDFRSEMRALRLTVEGLLKAGRVEEAERLMNEKRDEFEAHGYYIRRINQAYFAFYGSYADTPGSIDPIGPKLQELRNRAGSVAEFVSMVRGITTETGLDRLLSEG